MEDSLLLKKQAVATLFRAGKSVVKATKVVTKAPAAAITAQANRAKLVRANALKAKNMPARPGRFQKPVSSIKGRTMKGGSAPLAAPKRKYRPEQTVAENARIVGDQAKAKIGEGFEKAKEIGKGNFRIKKPGRLTIGAGALGAGYIASKSGND
jgi:hypothetical protein